MKQKHVIIGLTILTFLFFVTTAFSQNETKDIVTIRILEGTLKKNSKIMIIKSGEAEIINIDGFNTKEDPAKNFKQISAVLNKYLNDGYKIESSTTLSYGYNGMLLITDYILVKK